jgi:hypothetical protein
MKNPKFGLLTPAISIGLAVAVFAGHPVRASQTSSKLQATNYFMSVAFTNVPVPPRVAAVSDIPVNTNFSSSFEAGNTDGAGKIDGVGDIGWNNVDYLGPYSQGDVIASLSGSLTTVKSSLMISMTVKGSGFAQDFIGSNQALATLNLKFKNTTGIIAMTSLFTNSFGPVIVLTTNSDGSVSSNYASVVIQTNLTSTPSYQELVFTVASSDIVTNSSTQVTISNSIDSADNTFPFGTPLSTNGQQTITVGALDFTNVVIAYALTWDSSSTLQPVTNAILGLDISQVPLFISNYFAVTTYSTNVFSTNASVNRRFVQEVLSVQTNIAAGSTNLTTMNNLSNLWYEIDGNISGTIHAGGFSHSFAAFPAVLSANHLLYSAFQGTGSNTTLQAQFGTSVGGMPVPTNDNGLWYVGEQPIYNDSLTVLPFTYFDSDVKQAGNSLWMSAPQGDSGISLGLNGTGSLNAPNKAYKATLKGVGFSRGAAYKISGNTGLLTVGYTPGFNVVNFTNTAALTNLQAAGFDSNLTFEAYSNFGTNGAFTTTNFSVVSTDMVVLNGITNSVLNVLNGVPVPVQPVTNTIPNGITTVVLTGKVLGQTIGPINGTNASLPAPQ